MPRFKKSGSFTRFYVEGNMPSVHGDNFLVELAKHRFRTIENAASEEVSVGWVCPSDPSGGNFMREEILLDPHVRLRIRIDKKKLPATWLAIYLDAEIKARDGRKISAKERKEIKEDIAEKLLPRILPTVAFLDLFYDPKENTLYLFSTSLGAKEECMKLWNRSFGARLVEAGPLDLAFHLKLPQEQKEWLAKVSPMPLVAPSVDEGRGPDLAEHEEIQEVG